MKHRVPKSLSVLGAHLCTNRYKSHCWFANQDERNFKTPFQYFVESFGETDLWLASQTLLTEVKLRLQHRLSRKCYLCSGSATSCTFWSYQIRKKICTFLKSLAVITPTRCIHIEVAFIAHYSIIYILHHTYFPTESCINPEKPEGNCITVLQANLYKAIPFFLHLGSIPTDPNLVFILQKKKEWRS